MKFINYKQLGMEFCSWATVGNEVECSMVRLVWEEWDMGEFVNGIQEESAQERSGRETETINEKMKKQLKKLN